MAITFRTVLRVLVLACVLGALGQLALTTYRRGKQVLDTQVPTEFDVWAMKKLDYTGYAGSSQVVRITADEARLDRTRFGIFRIGFANNLFLRNARVGVIIDPSLRDQDLAKHLQRAARHPMWLESGRTLLNAVTGLRVERIAVNLKNAVGKWVEISADRCRAGPRGGGRVILRGHVRVISERLDLTFARLDYDVRRGSFVAGHRTEKRGKSQRSAPAVALLDEVNSAIREVGDIDWEAVKSNSPFAKIGS